VGQPGIQGGSIEYLLVNISLHNIALRGALD
jgi:hypothetical protein